MWSVDEVKGKKGNGAGHAPDTQIIKREKFNPNMVVNDLINKWTQEDQALIWSICAKGCTTSEFKLLLYTAAKYGFDPLLKEIWCYKVKTDDPAIIFVSRDGLRGKALEQGIIDGISFKEGIDEKVIFKDGDFTTKKDYYVEGTLHVKGWNNPVVHRVYYSEYAVLRWDQATKSRLPNRMWNFETGKPSTMLKKVCEAQMYKMAVNIKGMYIPEEFDHENGELEDKGEYIKGLERSVEETDFQETPPSPSVSSEEIKMLLEKYKEAGKDIYVHYREITGEELPKMLNNLSVDDYKLLLEKCPKVKKQEKISIVDMF